VRATTGGWLHLHASHLRTASDTHIAVVVEPAQPQSTLGVLLAAYALTAREVDVARLVLRGCAATRPRRSRARYTSPRTPCKTT
jgi:hypothetical protein